LAALFHTGDDGSFLGTLLYVGMGQAIDKLDTGMPLADAGSTWVISVFVDHFGPEIAPQIGEVPVFAIAGTYRTGDGDEMGSFVVMPLADK